MSDSLDRPVLEKSSPKIEDIQSDPSDRLKRAQDAMMRGAPEEALAIARPTPDGTPEIPALHYVRARAYFHLRRYQDCAVELERASTNAGPHAISLLLDEAVSIRRRDDLLPLLKICRKRKPDDFRLMNAGAAALIQLARFDEAELLLRLSLQRCPEEPNTLNLLALLLTETGRFEGALSVMAGLRDADPQDWEPLCNMACILSSMGRMEEAANLYRQAVPMAPQNARLRLNHSITMLKSGRMAQGWVEHEWRFGLPGHTSMPLDRLLPNISPSLDLRGKRVLITQEEGLGDTLMYLRYIPPLARTGAIIHIWGTETLAAICERVAGVSEVQFGGETPDYDYHCPFISLPRAFSGTPDAMGAPVPYLSADRRKAEAWRQRFQDDHKLRVGLVWAGAARPEDTAALMVDRQRSMPLSELAPLAGIEGASFYSLQKDTPAEQIPDFPAPLVNVMPDCHTMDDTAALMVNLDIIVSVDTSAVHLAGGLGKPVIMMDRINNCWRWLHGRDDTPWYPQMRIVRQTRFQDWSDVVERVKRLLEDAVAARRPGPQ
ncbi:tetratricopeptide repeat protein [Gluconobacter albidus]|uniref:tetratricopeptide repeat protein n=1 Tax=Gluconobacter albidus TaxID=318683 RepID=UPI001B8B3D43|nr:tetratricopeptide repeat protein [Gluconobacter albidus]MBS1027541.1 tetratricopeptide repeat protein [Gluconobacter albidus]